VPESKETLKTKQDKKPTIMGMLKKKKERKNHRSHLKELPVAKAEI
jgi:hypothetical protein